MMLNACNLRAGRFAAGVFELLLKAVQTRAVAKPLAHNARRVAEVAHDPRQASTQVGCGIAGDGDGVYVAQADAADAQDFAYS